MYEKRLPKINCGCESDCYCAENFAESERLKKHFEQKGLIFNP